MVLKCSWSRRRVSSVKGIDKKRSGVILYRSNVIGISHSVRERLNVCGAAVYVIVKWERLTPLKPRGNVGLVRQRSRKALKIQVSEG